MIDVNELRQVIANIGAPVIEVAGPTPEGYELFVKNNISIPSKPVVTNVEKEVVLNPYAEFPAIPTRYIVDEVVDVKAMPYADNSIGMIMVSCLNTTDTQSGPDENSDDIRQLALKEYVDVINGNLGAIDHALHLHLYREAARVLSPGGLLVQVSPMNSNNYEKAASMFGLKMIYEDGSDGQTVVLQK